MSWATLDGQIYNLINNNKDTIGLHEVIDSPSLSFEGYPSVTITPSDQPSDYETNTENTRVFAWRVRAFYETESTGLKGAKDRLLQVADELIDTVDRENFADTRTVGIGMPSKYTFIQIEPVTGSFFTVNDEHLMFLELTVRVIVSVSLV